MGVTTATTAPDFRVLRTDVPRLDPAPGVTLTLLVLAGDGVCCSGVDLASGVLVRTWAPEPPERRLRPYDVVEVTVATEAQGTPDPDAPEALMLASAPEAIGRLRGRRVERLLRPLLHPRDAPLLSSHGPAVAFWERRADHPSIAVAEPSGPVVLRRDANFLGCCFDWQDRTRELPCLDRRLAALMDRDGRRIMEAPRRSRLLVALTPPIGGHCHKVVEAVLPRP
jgi:hypothetical protein